MSWSLSFTATAPENTVKEQAREEGLEKCSFFQTNPQGEVAQALNRATIYFLCSGCPTIS